MYLKTLFAAAVGLLLSHPAAHAGDRGQITGLWNVTVTLTNCATGDPLPFPGAIFEAMALFERDGTFHDTNVMSPLQQSSAFGIWNHLNARDYGFAFRVFRFDSTGTLATGSQIVRHRLVLSADGESYQSSGTAEFYDVNGIRILPDGCSTSTATRFR